MSLPRRLSSLVVFAGCFAMAGVFFTHTRMARAHTIPKTEKAASKSGPPLIDLAGYRQMVRSYRGKALMVTFWATWCEPCRDEYPMIVELAKKYAPQGLAVVGISLDDTSDLGLVHQFLAQAHPNFRNYRQKPGIDVKAFYQGVNPDWRGTVPQTVFYGRDGHIARYLIGASPRPAFENAIRLILVHTALERQKSGSSVGE